MGNYNIFWMFENPRRCRQTRNFTTNVSKILDLKSPSEQIFSENCRWVPLRNILIQRITEKKRKFFFQDAGPPCCFLKYIKSFSEGH